MSCTKRHLAKTPAEVEKDLRQADLFEGLPDALLRRIAALAEPYPAYRGQTLIEEGDPGDEFFLLLEGCVKIQIESITPFVEIGINKLSCGEVFGEMSLLGDVERSATVVATENCDLYRLKAEPVLSIIRERAEWEAALMRNLARILGKRLRTMNRRMMNNVRTKYF